MSDRHILSALVIVAMVSFGLMGWWAWQSPVPDQPSDYAQWAQTGSTFVAVVLSALIAIAVPLFQRRAARRTHMEIAGKLCAQAMQTLDIRKSELDSLAVENLAPQRFFNPGSVARAMESVPVTELPATMTTSFVGLTGFLREAEKRFLEIEEVEEWTPPPAASSRGLARYLIGPSKEPIIRELKSLYEAAETDFLCLANEFQKEGIDIRAYRAVGT